MASVIAGAAVRANDALQKMLESKRKAVLEQQRANEVRQQQQDLKAYRSQTIQEGQARIQQQREAAESLAEYRKASLDQTALLAEQGRIHDENIARLDREQREKIAELERADEKFDAQSLKDRTRANILASLETTYITNFNEMPPPEVVRKWDAIIDSAYGVERKPDPTITEVPFYLRPPQDDDLEVTQVPDEQPTDGRPGIVRNGQRYDQFGRIMAEPVFQQNGQWYDDQGLAAVPGTEPSPYVIGGAYRPPLTGLSKLDPIPTQEEKLQNTLKQMRGLSRR
jgi:hypothetical protein